MKYCIFDEDQKLNQYKLVLKSNNERSIAKIIALAKKLDVTIEQKNVDAEATAKQTLKERILNFKAGSPSSFGDAAAWQKEQREDRDLPSILLCRF